MALIPLTDEQREAIAALVDDGRIEEVPVDTRRSAAFMQQAEDSLADIDNVTISQNRYSLAYGASHAVGEAVLAAYGYRTTNRAGHHDALIRFLAAVLADQGYDEAVLHLDRMKRARNQFQYEARPPSETDADVAARTAATLVEAAHARGLGMNNGEARRYEPIPDCGTDSRRTDGERPQCGYG